MIYLQKKIYKSFAILKPCSIRSKFRFPNFSPILFNTTSLRFFSWSSGNAFDSNPNIGVLITGFPSMVRFFSRDKLLILATITLVLLLRLNFSTKCSGFLSELTIKIPWSSRELTSSWVKTLSSKTISISGFSICALSYIFS